MRITLLTILLFALNNSFAQTFTLTQSANEPVIGDSYTSILIDTSNYTSGLDLAGGSNKVWNYTALISTSGTTSSTYMDPSSVPSSSNYPACTIVQKSGPLYSYYKSVSSPSTQIEFMGVSSSSINMNFTNSAVSARYPFAYGNTATDNYSGSFTYSFSGSASGSTTLTADGTGTLYLPNDTLTDVLRIKSIQNTSISSGGFPIGTLKMTNYDYYHSSQKFPIFNIQYQSMALVAQSPSVTAVVRGNSNNFVLGLRDAENSILHLKIYPNPAEDFIKFENIEELRGKEYTITNQLGQLSGKGLLEENIKVKDLSPGIYMISVKHEKGILRKKIIKE